MSDNLYNPRYQLKKYYDSLPFGDVTVQEKYYSSALGKVQELFLKSTSKTLERYINDVSISKVENRPVTYAVVKTLYETRSIYETCTPSERISTSSKIRHYASEYQVWDIVMPKAPESFVEQENIRRVEGSDYLEGCDRCGTSGRVDCYRCYDGYETCPSCNGHGDVYCPTCGGRGLTRCRGCGGAGYNIRTETVWEEDNDGHAWAKYIDVKENCYECGGDGEVNCSYCGGGGSVTCNTCGGDGRVYCSVCGGRQYLICPDCGGYGHLLYEVMAKQKYCVNSASGILGIYDLSERYPGYQLEMHSEDNVKLIAEITEEEHVRNIIWGDLLQNAYVDSLSVDEHATSLIESENRKVKDCNQIRQILNVFQKDVLDITYRLGEKEFYLVADLGNGTTYTSDLPFDDIVKSAVDLMEELISRDQYYDFYLNYEDITRITKQDTKLDTYGIKMNEMYRKVTSQFFNFMLLGSIGGSIADTILRLVLQRPVLQSILFWITSLIPVGLAYFLKGDWYRLKQNGRNKFRILALGGGFTITAILKLLTWIF